MSMPDENKAKFVGQLLWHTISAPAILVGELLGKAGNAAFPKCGNCNKRLGRFSNMIQSLAKNYAEHKMADESVLKQQFLCQKCFDSHAYTRCKKTGQVFRCRDDCGAKFRSSQMRRNLSPHHPSSQIYESLSPEGLAIIDREHQDLQSRYRSWAGCTKQDYIRGYRVTKEIKLIRSDSGFDDPAEVENSLKWYCLQIGGNGLTKFFWDKHIRHHEEEYVAGHGKNGNPYYRTRRWTTADFSGHAVAVVAEATSVSSKSRRDSNGGGGGGGGDSHGPKGPRPSGPSVGTEAYYANILELKGKCTKEEIKSAYRKLIAEYHPDKVAHLGTELRELASTKAKALNEAFEFFSKKYKI